MMSVRIQLVAIFFKLSEKRMKVHLCLFKYIEISDPVVCSATNFWGVPQVPQAQCEHGRQKYKDLYGNPDKKLKKIII